MRGERDRQEAREKRMNVKRFEDIGVWHEAVSLAVGIYAFSKSGGFALEFDLEIKCSGRQYLSPPISQKVKSERRPRE